jgi:tRNA(adenine34) deaminase
MNDCTLFVTLEPCPMCAGAILAARVGRVVYAAKDPVAGAMGSVLNLPRFPLGAHPVVEGGVLLEEARDLLQSFFRARREE